MNVKGKTLVISFFYNVCMKIVRTYVSIKPNQLNRHDHAFELVKKIVYIWLRLKHHMKEENEGIKKKRIRSRL